MSLFFEQFLAPLATSGRAVLPGRAFLRERKEVTATGDEDLLSVSEYSGVTRRRDNIDDGDFVSRAESLDGYRVVRRDDLVVNYMLAWKGALGVSDLEGITSPAYAVFELDPAKVCPRYAHALLRSDLSKAYFRTESTGIIESRLRLYPESLLALRMVLPAISEQRRIADYLDRETARIDALVEKKTRFIELLREKRRALVATAVTRGLRDGVALQQTGIDELGPVPAHWAVRPLKYVARIQTGVAKGKSVDSQEAVEVPYLRVANVQDGFIDLTEVASIEIAREDVPRYLLRPGDVLMNEGGDFDKLGRGHIWRGEIDPCIHQNHVFAVRPDRVSSEWLNLYTGSAPAQFYFMGRSKQSTNLASISSSNLMELPVPIPPPEEQQAVLDALASQVSDLDRLAQFTQRSVDLLIERRAALITAAVTGQINVGAEQPVEDLEPA